MKFKYSKEFAIGLSVIAALVVVYFGIEYLKGNNIFKPANYYYASYHNVAGLAQSAPVTLNGYKVGLVREITYDYEHPGNVSVEMSLDKELRLPEDTKAIITTDMLGTSSIDLQLGTSAKYHEVGSQLIGGQAGGLMTGVTEDILPAVGRIMPKIDSLITSLNALASDPALRQSLGHLEIAMANIESSSKRLSQVMSTMPKLASDASFVMTNVKEISSSLNTIASDLTTVSAQIKEMPLEKTMNNVAQASESLKELMAKINDKNSSVGMLLNDDGLYQNLNNASASLDSLLRDVKKNPKRYISIKLL